MRRGFFEDFAAAEKLGTLGSQAMCATPWDSNPSKKNEIEVLRRPVESTAASGRHRGNKPTPFLRRPASFHRHKRPAGSAYEHFPEHKGSC